MSFYEFLYVILSDSWKFVRWVYFFRLFCECMSETALHYFFREIPIRSRPDRMVCKRSSFSLCELNTNFMLKILFANIIKPNRWHIPLPFRPLPPTNRKLLPTFSATQLNFTLIGSWPRNVFFHSNLLP